MSIERLSRLISVKRPTHQFVFFRDSLVPDLREVLRGRMATTSESECIGVSLLTGEEHVVSQKELLVLSRIPSDRWVSVAALEAERTVVERLVACGLILSDGDDPRAVELRIRDETLARQNWFRYAAAYHFMSKWRGATQAEAAEDDLAAYGERLQDALREFVVQHDPPPHFHRIAEPESREDLPLPSPEGELYRVLTKRMTQRVFDRETALPRSDLSTLLYYVYGCHGIADVFGKLSIIKKTSPSGGSMHPVEVYPLIMRVEGMACGLYHYDVESHALERIRGVELSEAEALAEVFAAGQIYARDAAALFLLTARFERTFWKYRDHAKAYRVVLMDAAHLSQTFYLVCAELGLGAFFTTAINECEIEDALALDGMEQGVLAISACGLRDTSPERRPFSHGPYRHRARSS